MPADVRLTDVVILLDQSLNKVADFLEDVRNIPQTSDKAEGLKIEESDNVPCGGTEEDPYFIEVDNQGCSKCRAGRTWVVIDPDGYGGGTSYELIGDAEELAEDLNQAYNRGKLSQL